MISLADDETLEEFVTISEQKRSRRSSIPDVWLARTGRHLLVVTASTV
ncbi:hypothetical protein [Haloterrigena sp. H1]|nr:hypothetical protein [Haloterrigena sp. H1]